MTPTGGESLGGIASTAGQFVAGLFGGMARDVFLAAAAGVGPGLYRRGAWLGAAGLGMALRVAAGQGTAAAFVLVALAFLGLFLLGWRLVVRLVGFQALTGIRAAPTSKPSAMLAISAS